MHYRDRYQAGRFLAAQLLNYKDRPEVLVLGLPRGGVAVAFEVAGVLNAPLDVLIVRKIGLPGWRELGMGAIASGGVELVRQETAREFGISEEEVREVIREEREELGRRERLYRDDLPLPEVTGKIVILVDDGLATGSTMRAAVEAIRYEEPQKIVVAVPIGAEDTCRKFRENVDELICAHIPRQLHAIGEFYENFDQLTDAEVQTLLKRARQAHAAMG